MKTEIFEERSFFPELLRPGGWVLDVGARGYLFTNEMVRRGMGVVAVDPKPPSTTPSSADRVILVIAPVYMVVAGLVGIGHAGRATFASWDNGEPDCLVGWGGPVPEQASLREVETLDVRQLMARFGVPSWELVKMNCEGAEYDILGTWPGPIARQITVSFHDHTGANPGGDATYKRLFAHLSEWYDVERHVWEERYGAGGSYYDSLFVLRGVE